MASSLNRLEFNLGHVGFALAAQAHRVISKIAHDVQRDAQAMCPVDTGNLKSSISIEFDIDGLGFRVGPTASYGIFVEGGTSRMAPRAFLGPALDRNTPAAVHAMGLLGATLVEGSTP